jgi:hypothetical protein
MNKQTNVLYPRATHYAANKENTFPFLFLGCIFFFLSFSIILEKIMLRYKGGMSVANIQVQGAG